MPTKTPPKYLHWFDPKDNVRPYKFQQNLGGTARVFKFCTEARRDKELRRARRLGPRYVPSSEGE